MLNQHIHQAAAERLQGDALEDLGKDTQRRYAEFLEKELQLTLDYFELIDENLIKEIPLEEEDNPNFSYPAEYDWKEGDYMWLLFKIQQHFSHRDVWNGIYGFINRTQPRRKVDHQRVMVELTESWQDLFEKAVWVKRRAKNTWAPKMRGPGGKVPSPRCSDPSVGANQKRGGRSPSPEAREKDKG